ncbi:CorA family divalent cation transporter [Kangiella sediminilitoris]|uniref:Mg2 transporter protein CorA family protein n=1 Tax=Kangiella sediminilitoris TaxID=1144748 RepID=A0A1B3BAK2_9GAMM|nr:CorA family divalent cation transporter [Kangiella sediminilitoris]AOE49829.1 Mg2 transporter protein CorA family protein [Kangiella sediminilitoris]
MSVSSYIVSNKGALIESEGTEAKAYTLYHMNYSVQTDREWLEEREGINNLFKEQLLKTETRPTFYQDDHSVLVCLRGVNLNPGADPEDMISIRVWISEDTVIISTNRHSLSLEDIIRNLSNRLGPKTPGEFLAALIERLAIRIEEFFEKFESELDSQEDNIELVDGQTAGAELGNFRRQAATVKRYLTPQKEALDKLQRIDSSLFTAEVLQDMKDDRDKIARLLEDLELSRERSMALQEQLLARIGYEQNNRLYVLAIISAIFLPLTFLSGMLGMNVAGLPGTKSTSAFWIVSGVCLLIAIGLLIWFKHKKWY